MRRRSVDIRNDMEMLLNFVTVCLSVLGLWISVYFTGVYYRWFSPDVRWMPQVCRMTDKSCRTVLDTPRAKLFGVPNAVFGIAAYLYVILNVFFFPAWLGLLILSLALLRSLYLAYSLLFVTKIPCPLCFTTHAVNLILFLIYLKRL